MMSQVVESPFMVVQFKWNLVSIPHAAMTIISKMVKFRDVYSFRAAIRHHYESQTSALYFLTTDLNKIGVKVLKVTYSTRTGKMVAMNRDEEKNGDVNGSLQLFTAPLPNLSNDDCCYFFNIHFAGITENYCIQEKDGRLNEQLRSFISNKFGADFEFIAGGKRFPVHKFIIAARSPVFAALLNTVEQPNVKELNVSAAAMEQFLKFVYTGELDGIVEPGVGQLAAAYQIKPLEDLCEFASHDVDEDEMAELAMQLKSGGQRVIWPDADFEIDPSLTSRVVSFTWNVTRWDQETPGTKISTSPAFEYREKKLFRVRLEVNQPIGEQQNPNSTGRYVKPTFVIYQHRKIHSKVTHVAYSINEAPLKRLREKPTSDEMLLQLFIASDCTQVLPSPPFSITFEINLVNTLPNFRHYLVDSSWKEQIWASSLNKLLTDVVLLVGELSFSAHRCLLSARSPVFAALFNGAMEEEVRIRDTDPATFRVFLEFLYTGTLVLANRSDQLFVVAQKYEVETLMELCRPIAQPTHDVDDLSRIFLSC